MVLGHIYRITYRDLAGPLTSVDERRENRNFYRSQSGAISETISEVGGRCGSPMASSYSSLQQKGLF